MNFVKVAFFPSCIVPSREARDRFMPCELECTGFNLTRGSRSFGKCQISVQQTVLAYASMMAEGNSIYVFLKVDLAFARR